MGTRVWMLRWPVCSDSTPRGGTQKLRVRLPHVNILIHTSLELVQALLSLSIAHDLIHNCRYYAAGTCALVRHGASCLNSSTQHQ